MMTFFSYQVLLKLYQFYLLIRVILHKSYYQHLLHHNIHHHLNLIPMLDLAFDVEEL